ncbi:hypothetical protein RchiOBHm_Chr4g0400211 [Rosa chinensis]|uniref:Uncharacterized protein n=1 Tax=Rosa chinensis TaxID=74649 RepID=A0A2P6QSR8_ROSCH|nr:hypothetical protein RchiOBHm_Chr4g0400211 [Rosa chinensis]
MYGHFYYMSGHAMVLNRVVGSTILTVLREEISDKIQPAQGIGALLSACKYYISSIYSLEFPRRSEFFLSVLNFWLKVYPNFNSEKWLLPRQCKHRRLLPDNLVCANNLLTWFDWIHVYEHV